MQRWAKRWQEYTKNLHGPDNHDGVITYLDPEILKCEVKWTFSSVQFSCSVVSDSVRPHRWQPTRLPHSWDSPGKNTGVGCHFLLQCRKVKSESEVIQSCQTLSNPVDCSLPGSSVHGIIQARVLEWGAIAFSIAYARYLLFLSFIVPILAWNIPLRSLFSWMRSLVFPILFFPLFLCTDC